MQLPGCHLRARLMQCHSDDDIQKVLDEYDARVNDLHKLIALVMGSVVGSLGADPSWNSVLPLFLKLQGIAVLAVVLAWTLQQLADGTFDAGVVGRVEVLRQATRHGGFTLLVYLDSIALLKGTGCYVLACA